MEKKFIELSLNETQAVVGGVKTATAAISQMSAANVSARPDLGANAAMAAPTAPSRPAISLPSLPKR